MESGNFSSQDIASRAAELVLESSYHDYSDLAYEIEVVASMHLGCPDFEDASDTDEEFYSGRYKNNNLEYDACCGCGLLSPAIDFNACKDVEKQCPVYKDLTYCDVCARMPIWNPKKLCKCGSKLAGHLIKNWDDKENIDFEPYTVHIGNVEKDTNVHENVFKDVFRPLPSKPFKEISPIYNSLYNSVIEGSKELGLSKISAFSRTTK
jgi:hypothetical protein